MLGIVFTSLLDMVEETFSAEVADEIASVESLESNGIYTAVGSYPYTDAIKMVIRLSEITGISVDELVNKFGEYLFGRLAERYSTIFEPHTTFIDFLFHLETSIHTEVRKLYPHAELPIFECVMLSPNSVEMNYRSKRPMVNLALGLLRGCSLHYGVDYTVEVIRKENAEQNEAVFIVTQKSPE